MDRFGQFFEQFKVAGKDLAAKVHDLIHEGNVRRIIIKDEQGHTFMEIPLSVAAIGVILSPVLAAVGAVATLVSRFEVVVERSAPAAESSQTHPAGTGAGSGIGATEDEVDMRGTVPQRVDRKGTKVEDIAGTGEHDSSGG